MQSLRSELDKQLEEKIKNPRYNISEGDLIKVITQLIITDGLIGPQQAGLWV